MVLLGHPLECGGLPVRFTGSETRPNLQGLVLDGQAQIKD